MSKKKAVHAGGKKKSSGAGSKAKVAKVGVPTDLSDAEKDLVLHMEQGWKLDTDSLGSDLVLRRNDEVVRPATANRNTIKALEERGLIVQGKGHEPLKIRWRLREKR